MIASDINDPKRGEKDGPFEKLDVLDKARYDEIVENYQITEICHLAALLSANAEKSMELAWKLNMDGLLNTFDLAKKSTIINFPDFKSHSDEHN